MDPGATSLRVALCPHWCRAALHYLRAGCSVTEGPDWNYLERPPTLRRKAKLRVATRLNAAWSAPQNELVCESARPVKTALASATGPRFAHCYGNRSTLAQFRR